MALCVSVVRAKHAEVFHVGSTHCMQYLTMRSNMVIAVLFKLELTTVYDGGRLEFRFAR